MTTQASPYPSFHRRGGGMQTEPLLQGHTITPSMVTFELLEPGLCAWVHCVYTLMLGDGTRGLEHALPTL